jgi:hypothetical protein
MTARSDIVWRMIALLALGTSVAALALALLLWDRVGPRQMRTAGPAAPRAPSTAAPALAGRTATLSRLMAERRAVARAELVFGAKGVLDVTCRAEAADGALSACFGDEKGTGTWSLSGSTLCLSAAALNLASSTCYELGGDAPQLTLAGPGLLAGSLLLR